MKLKSIITLIIIIMAVLTKAQVKALADKGYITAADWSDAFDSTQLLLSDSTTPRPHGGMCTPSTTPNIIGASMYETKLAGTYTNFGSLVVLKGEHALFVNNPDPITQMPVWTKQLLNVGGEYSAVLNQVGTDDPTEVAVYSDTFPSVTHTITKTGTGEFTIEFSAAVLTVNKTKVKCKQIITNSSADVLVGYVESTWATTSTVIIRTYAPGTSPAITPANGIINGANFWIEIVVIP